MNESIALLLATAISIGFIHTILGPDHYLPFIVLSEAKKWTLRKTMFITFLCGLGHVLSSVVLGLVGIGVGISVNRLVHMETFRGNIAAWLFIAFGLVYLGNQHQESDKKRRSTATSIFIWEENPIHMSITINRSTRISTGRML